MTKNHTLTALTILTVLSLAGCVAHPTPMPDHRAGYNETRCHELDREMANGTMGHNETAHELACGLLPGSMSKNTSTNSFDDMSTSDNSSNKTNSTGNMSGMG